MNPTAFGKGIPVTEPDWLATKVDRAWVTAEEAKEIFHYTRSDGITGAVRRGVFPKPDGTHGPKRMMYWFASTIRAEIARRQEIIK